MSKYHSVEDVIHTECVCDRVYYIKTWFVTDNLKCLIHVV